MLADNSQEESTRKRRSNSRDSHGSTRPGTESDSTISLRQGGLLQLSSLGYFRTTVTTAAVCL